MVRRWGDDELQRIIDTPEPTHSPRKPANHRRHLFTREYGTAMNAYDATLRLQEVDGLAEARRGLVFLRMREEEVRSCLLYSVFCLLSPVFCTVSCTVSCLLSSVFCLVQRTR